MTPRTLKGVLLAGGLALAATAASAVVTHAAASCPRGPNGEPTAATRVAQGDKLVKLADDRVIHRFFDTSPLSPSGRYVALIRFDDENRSVQPGDKADIVLVELETGRERKLAETQGFELQLGAHVQWGKDDRQLFFSDVDRKTWKAKTVVLDPLSGRRRELDGPLFSVSRDGARVSGYDAITSRFAQVGYGVVVPNDHAPRVYGPSVTNGVYVTETATGRSSLVASSRQIFDTLAPVLKVERPEEHEFYVFQTKWNPQGDRLLISYQWAPRGGGDRRRAAITLRPDGSDIKLAIGPEQWARGGHHINWMADGERVSMNLNVDDDAGLELVTVRYDGSDLKVVYEPGSGHPVQHPRGLPLMVTDAYPNEPVSPGGGLSPIRLIDLEAGTETRLADIFVSDSQGEFRIDPHPAWDRSGRYVLINGFVGCTRNVWLLDLREQVEAVERRARSRGRP